MGNLLISPTMGAQSGERGHRRNSLCGPILSQNLILQLKPRHRILRNCIRALLVRLLNLWRYNGILLGSPPSCPPTAAAAFSQLAI